VAARGLFVVPLSVRVARDIIVPLRPFGFMVAVLVRVTGSVVRGATDKEPARVASVFWARVCVFVRVASAPPRPEFVVVRDCVVPVSRTLVVDTAPSRTPDNAGAPATRPKNTPKIRIFFISG
jgi:hypothetical protein